MYVVTFSYILSNRVTFHDRHEMDNCCFLDLWYVHVYEKYFFLVFRNKLDTSANNLHLHYTLIGNFYASRVNSDPNFLFPNEWDLLHTEFC